MPHQSRLWSICLLLSCLAWICDPVVVHAAPSAQPGAITLTISNDSDQIICAVYISAATANNRGENRLGNNTIVPQKTARFPLAPGSYAVLLMDCDGNVLLTKQDLTINRDDELLLTQSDVSRAACEVYRQNGLDAYHHDQYQQALTAFQAALTCHHDVGDSIGESATLNNLGLVYESQDRHDEAIASYQQALAIIQELGDRAGESAILNNIGTVYTNQGRYTDALASYTNALAIAQEINSRAATISTLESIGNIYEQQIAYDKALATYQQAIQLIEAVNPVVQAASDYNDITFDPTTVYERAIQLYRQQGQLDKAIETSEHRRQYVYFATLATDHVTTIENVVPLLSHISELERLRQSQEEQLTQARSQVLRAQEQVALLQTQLTAAEQDYQERLTTSREVAAAEALVSQLQNKLDLANAQVQANQDYITNLEKRLTQIDRERQTALTRLEATADLLEATLDQYNDLLRSIDQELTRERALAARNLERINTLESQRTAVEQNYKAAQAALAETAEAQRDANQNYTTLRRSLEQDLAKYKQQVPTYQTQVSTTNGQLQQARREYTAASEQLAALPDEAELDRLRQSIREEYTQASAQAMGHKERTNLIEEQLASTLSEYQMAVHTITARNDQLAAFIPNVSPVFTVQQAQALLDQQTTVIYYDMTPLGKMTAYVFTASASPIEIALPDATPWQVASTLRSLYRWINLEQPQPRPLRDLYHWLIAPLREHLKTSQIMIIPTQMLHYVPFTALVDDVGSNATTLYDSSYFGQQYQIAILPALQLLPALQENASHISPSSSKSALIFGNPATAEAGLKPLVYAADEANSVASLFATPAYLAQDASEQRLYATIDNMAVIHIAAHGHYNAKNPMLSAIYLAPASIYDGRLETRETYGLSLQGNEIIVLSGCETNVGDLSTGNEIISLTRGFFYAGASTVVSSLWGVDDAATETLMVSFYRHWLEDGMSKAAALQAAQADVRANPHWSSPFYWAGFVLNGHPGASK